MEKMIKVSGREVAFKATANTPKIYRQLFGRDILVDIQTLQNAMDAYRNNDQPLTMDTLEIFERVSYVMAKQADPNVPDDMDVWLDDFDMFSIWEILPQIVALWGLNMRTTSESKKKASKPKGR